MTSINEPTDIQCLSPTYKQQVIDYVNSTNTAFATFVDQFYQYIPLDYACDKNIEMLAKISEEAFDFYQTYHGPEDKVSLSKCLDAEKSTITIKIITTNKPFIVDSIKCILREYGLLPSIFLDPVLQRDQISTQEYAFILIKLYAKLDDVALHKLEQDISEVLALLSAVHTSTPLIINMLDQLIYTSNKERSAFLNWLKLQFIFLGVATYQDHKLMSHIGDTQIIDLTTNLTNKYISNEITIGSINYISKIYKKAFVDYILIKADITYIFVGLFESGMRDADSIPIIREKMKYVLDKSNFKKDSYNYKNLHKIIECIPRPALFQINSENLYSICMWTLSSMMMGRLKFFTWQNQNITHILIFINHLTHDTHQCINNYIAQTFQCSIPLSSEYIVTPDLFCIYYSFPERNMDQQIASADTIEQELTNITAPWEEKLYLAFLTKYDNLTSAIYAAKYQNTFRPDYRYKFDGACAYQDLQILLPLSDKIAFNWNKTSQNKFYLKIYATHTIFLSDTIPIVENLGFIAENEQTFQLSLPCLEYRSAPHVEHPHSVNIALPQQDTATDHIIKYTASQSLAHHYACNNAPNIADAEIVKNNTITQSTPSSFPQNQNIWLYYLELSSPLSSHINDDNIADIKRNVEQVLAKVFEERMANNALCKLVLLTNMEYRHIQILQALSAYLKQLHNHTLNAVHATLVNHPAYCSMLMELFDARFNPISCTKLDIGKITEYIQNVDSSAEDKILTHMLHVLMASTRTNAYQINKNYLSFKFTHQSTDNKTALYAEIYVYAEHFEGVHLRGGKVARGGIRWSDRKEDYRTEILGLMKAQMLKNTIVVPVGSKGGFFIKRHTISPVECYKDFLRGILDITDNIVENKIVHPTDTVIHDNPDPYLVVAADKGTAGFSDYANTISQEYGFWLHDAFASGGHSGYSHKGMGITSKGAWISVCRHFQKIGIDINYPFTVIGIGDMSGDVFGNGLLMSDKIKLIAAFNHQHVFIDPDPDPNTSYQERLRLFNKPYSTWADYDIAKISPGGGVFARASKTITLFNEIMALLDINKHIMHTDDLIKTILCARVDLIWNGGIGTYIKASTESDQDIMDKFNDDCRCNATDIMAKVIAEGGNLGVSQLGRIEYAKQGGQINTDFIDNSGGVTCSDYEVNIKIALMDVPKEARSQLLHNMTKDVETLVLAHNYAQNQALNVMEESPLLSMHIFREFLTTIEDANILNREAECIPTDNELEHRTHFTRPELAVILSYSKMHFYNTLLNSDIDVSSSEYDQILLQYFPNAMHQYKSAILKHPLRKEIILTVLTNNIINKIPGPLFARTLSKYPIARVIEAYIQVISLFNINQLWKDSINAHNISVSSDIITILISLIENVLHHNKLPEIQKWQTGSISDLLQYVQKTKNTATHKAIPQSR